MNIRTAAAHGQTIRLTVRGKSSHLSRTVFVYLPPQYFRTAFSSYRFPVIELLPGFPGSPADWINVVGITAAYSTLLADGAAVKPAVLVMPDTNGGRRISLQCLNVRHGPQDATFLAHDLPAYLPRILRVQPQGPAWGIAGYSEGGYCTANLALVYRLRYGAAGVMSGYFVPSDDQLGNPVHTVNPFGHDLHARRTNTPLLRITRLPVSARIPPVLARRRGEGHLRASRGAAVPAPGPGPAARRPAECGAGRRAHHGHLAGPGALAAGVDDAAADGGGTAPGPGQPGREGARWTEGPAPPGQGQPGGPRFSP